jgi:hypothetical protein
MEGIRDLYEAVGGFGVLLFIAGKDVGTRQQRARSWRLFMQQLAPHLAELGPDPVDSSIQGRPRHAVDSPVAPILEP